MATVGDAAASGDVFDAADFGAFGEGVWWPISTEGDALQEHAPLEKLFDFLAADAVDYETEEVFLSHGKENSGAEGADGAGARGAVEQGNFAKGLALSKDGYALQAARGGLAEDFDLATGDNVQAIAFFAFEHNKAAVEELNGEEAARDGIEGIGIGIAKEGGLLEEANDFFVG